MRKSLCSTQTPFSITQRHTSPTSWATQPSSQTAASSTPTAAGTTPIKTKCNFSTGRSLSAKTDRHLPATPSSTTAPTVLARYLGTWCLPTLPNQPFSQAATAITTRRTTPRLPPDAHWRWNIHKATPCLCTATQSAPISKCPTHRV